MEKTQGELTHGLEATQQKDEVVLSENAVEFARFKELLRTLPEERSDVVASLASQVKEGTYNVETEKVVDKLVEESIMTHGLT